MKTAFKKMVSVVLALSLMILVIPAMGTQAAAAEPTCQVQWEDKWLNYYYGSYNLYNTGCGMFSFCNAVHYLTGNNPSVTAVSQWAADNDWLNGSCGGGTTYSFFYNMEWKYGSTYGFSVPSDGEDGTWNSSVLMAHLANGGVAIGNVPGHFIAIVGYDYNTDMYHIYDSAPSYGRETVYGNNGNIWISRSQLNANTSSMYLRWFCRLSRTGAAPAWYEGSPSAGTPANLGDSFYARIYNSAYDKYVDVEGENPIAFNFNTSDSQVWKFERQDSNNAYKITNTKIGKVLDLKGADDTPGGDIITYSDVGSNAQRWYLVHKNGGYVIQCKASLSNALDIDTGGKTGIANWGENGKENQVFQINIVSQPSAGQPANLGKDFYAHIYNPEYDRYVSLEYDNPIAFARNEEDNSQIWKFEWQSDGSYKIINHLTGKLLDLKGADTTAGADIITYGDVGSSAQRWYLIYKNGGYVIQCKASLSNALDIDTGGKTGIANWGENGKVNQVFLINKLSVGYTVNHYTQNLEGKASLQDTSNYTLAETESIGFTPVGNVTALRKNYTNRVTPDEITVTLAEDGSTVINYFYSLMYGDVNEDDTVNATDLIRLKRRLISNDETASALSERLSDINGDGKVSLGDMLRLKMYLADSTIKIGD